MYPRHPFLLPIGQARNFFGTHSQRQTIVVAMNEGTVQSGNDTLQDLQFLNRHQKIIELWEEEISDYNYLLQQLREESTSRAKLQEELLTKDKCIIELQTAYTRSHLDFCNMVQE